ncbi:hypothetical protein AB0K81_32650, partial [Streptomyces werraensis]|uniref:hypothetical protein n=1 Tax=Streptomyces werraensis TaxID=68284 RepID=UPI00341CA794
VLETQRHHSPVEPSVPAAEHQTFLKLTYKAREESTFAMKKFQANGLYVAVEKNAVGDGPRPGRRAGPTTRIHDQ